LGKAVDYAKAPSEDFASLTFEFETSDGHRVIGEASTSWSFVGAGLRLSAELLGPEYSMRWNSLDSGLQLFFSREVTGRAGEDLVEKQNAEQGVMPVVPQEYIAYGYTDEDRHFVRAFLGKDDYGLKLLSVETAQDKMRRVSIPCGAGTVLPTAPGALASGGGAIEAVIAAFSAASTRLPFHTM